MSSEDRARERLIEHRQHEEKLHQSGLSRSEAEIKSPADTQTQEEARELMADHRLHEEKLHQSMLKRSEE
ncbi:MAG: hypothetical protein KME26_05755 [Oscillatoria princeps RMCB-10]|nr:hypothetical protein [Oscillatoria princeps RMCB-10]